MIQLPLFDNKNYIWKIYILAKDEYNCELLDFINGADKRTMQDWARLQANLEHIAKSEEGAKTLNKFSHELGSKKYKIFSFSQGSLRISWFYGTGNKMILCAHAYKKKSQKTNRKDIKKAESYYERYFDDITRKNK